MRLSNISAARYTGAYRVPPHRIIAVLPRLRHLAQSAARRPISGYLRAVRPCRACKLYVRVSLSSSPCTDMSLLHVQPMKTSRLSQSPIQTHSPPPLDRSGRLRRRSMLQTRTCSRYIAWMLIDEERVLIMSGTQVTEKCPECGHMEAYSKEAQVRLASLRVVFTA